MKTNIEIQQNKTRKNSSKCCIHLKNQSHIAIWRKIKKKSSMKSFVVKSGGFIWHFLAAFDCQGLLTAGSAVRQGFSTAAGNWLRLAQRRSSSICFTQLAFYWEDCSFSNCWLRSGERWPSRCGRGFAGKKGPLELSILCQNAFYSDWLATFFSLGLQLTLL